MRVMILAAGLGTRLEPLTNIRPKPLFPVLNQPLLGIAIEQLRAMGTTGIVINAHHLSEMVEKFVKGCKWGIEVEVRVEPKILGTGGGIKNCADFFRDTPFFVVVNADIYHTYDLGPALRYHTEGNNLATLILCDDPRFNQVGIDEQGRIINVRRREVQRSPSPVRVLTFTGIHIISPRLLDSMPAVGYFDIMESYIALASEGELIKGYEIKGGYWQDIGRIEDYRALHQDLMWTGRKLILHPEADIEEGVRMEGAVCVGRRTCIKAGAFIKESIIWDDCLIEAGSMVEGCVVADGTRVRGAHQGEALIPG
jgi:NDP-sugar pyrophosphorylase family protein